MALSGSTTLKSVYHWHLKFSWTATQNVGANTSAVAWQVIFSIDSGWPIHAGARSGSVTVNGAKTNFNFTATSEGGSIVVAKGATTIVHDSDGNKTFGVSAVLPLNFTSSTYGYIGSLAGSASYSLNKIARASTMSWVAADSPHEFGKTQHFTVTAANSAYLHGIEMRVNGKLIQPPLLMDSVGGGTKSLVIPLDIMNSYPNSSTATGISFRLITYTTKGTWSTGLIGYKDYPLLSCNFPASVVPDITSVTGTDSSEVPTKLGTEANSGLYVQGQSIVNMAVATTTAYSSPIKSYAFAVVNGPSYSTTISPYDMVTTDFKTGGSKEVTVTVTDGRGRTATKSFIFNLTAYSPPSITKFDVTRNGTTPSTVDITKSVGVSSLKVGTAEKNLATVMSEYKISSATDWTKFKAETANLSASLAIPETAVDKSYDIRITLTDQFGSAVALASVSTQKVLMDFHTDEGVGIGKLHQTDHGVLDVGGDVWIDGVIRLAGIPLIDIMYPVGYVLLTTAPENPGLGILGGTWERWGNGRVPVGIDEADTDFSTPGVTAGAKDSELRALIGAYNNDAKTLAYAAGSPVAGEGHRSIWLKGMGNDVASAVTKINHTVLVKGTDGKNMPRTQPSIAVYMWRRTA